MMNKTWNLDSDENRGVSGDGGGGGGGDGGDGDGSTEDEDEESSLLKNNHQPLLRRGDKVKGEHSNDGQDGEISTEDDNESEVSVIFYHKKPRLTCLLNFYFCKSIYR